MWCYSMSHRKKERTTALVVSAVLAGFRAIDTGQSSEYYLRLTDLRDT